MTPPLHNATFSWPLPTPSSVIVTGTFDSWSGNTHHLSRDPASGGWKGTVEIPWGEKVAYKYVVDGTWMTREDEAKEWGKFWHLFFFFLRRLRFLGTIGRFGTRSGFGERRGEERRGDRREELEENRRYRF
jgi:hypothetical protein